GVMCGFLVGFLLSGAKSAEFRNLNRLYLVIATFLGVVGMLLTFSRSTFFGLGLAIAIAVMRRGKATALIIAAAGVLTVAGIGFYLLQGSDLSNFGIATRLLNFSAHSTQNLERVKHIAMTLHVLQVAPFFGDPALG